MLLSTAAIMTSLTFTPFCAKADPIPTNSWDYDTVLDGNVSKDISTAGLTNITVDNGNGYVEGNADIYVGHTVNVAGDINATFAYKDNRDNIESTLSGNLNSNMNIVVIDKDGLFFTKDATIDVQSIVATTGDIAVADIMDGGAMTISNIDQGNNIQIDGQITVAEAGLAAFVSPFVTNNGIISAKMGTVAMGAGETVTIDMYGDGLVELAVEGELADALITNAGEINAEGGLVQITAKAAKNTVDNIINNSGIITASSAHIENGKIILGGGEKGAIKNSGQINGGAVNIIGERFVQKEKLITLPLSSVPTPALKPSIRSNEDGINISTSGDVIIRDGEIHAQGGDINIENGGTFTSIAEAVKTSGSGTITLTQNEGGEIQNAIDAINNTGTGNNTINVGAGIFAETVHIDEENTTLNGANAGISYNDARGFETIIKPDADSVGVYITANNATVDGVLVEGGASGVLVNGADSALIQNNIIRNQYHFSGDDNYTLGDGIHLHQVTDSLVTHNAILNTSGKSIHGKNTTDIIISNNYVEAGEGSGGIALVSSSGKAMISDNSILSAFIGIDAQHVNHIQILRNNILNAKNSGIQVFDAEFAQAYENVISSKKMGINISDSRKALLSDYAVHGNVGNKIYYSDVGILLKNIEHGYSHKSDIIGVGTGVKTINSNIGMKSNNIHAYEYGLYSDGLPQYANIDNNTNVSNGIGFYLIGQVDGRYNFGENYIQSMDSGIYALSNVSGNLHFYENSIFSGNYGIYFAGALGKGVSFINNERIDAINNGITINILGVDSNGSINASGNKNISSKFGDGIHVTSQGNSEKNISATIFENIVHNVALNGIYAKNVLFEDRGIGYQALKGNKIISAGNNGIKVINVGASLISDNEISFSAGSGIAITSSDAIIRDNYILYSGSDGITLSNPETTEIINNTIIQSRDNGILINRPLGKVLIKDNTIDTSEQAGIKIYNPFLPQNIPPAIISNNTVKNSKLFGISVLLNDSYEITNNTIEYSGTGIHAFAAFDSKVKIDGNSIRYSTHDGINAASHTLSIENNVIENSSNNGITAKASNLEIQHNRINNSSQNGMFIEDRESIIFNNVINGSNVGVYFSNPWNGYALSTEVIGNTINAINDAILFERDITNTSIDIAHNVIDSGGNGVAIKGNVDNSFVSISDNYIVSGQNGILIDGDINGGDINISHNKKIESDYDAIHIEGNLSDTNVIVQNNGDLRSKKDDGIEIIDTGDSYSGYVQVSENTTYDNYDDGIHIRGVSNASITDNTVYYYDPYKALTPEKYYYRYGDGIHVENSDSSIIVRNTIRGSVAHGLHVENSNNATIDLNNITSSGWDGIHVSGGSSAHMHDNSIGSSGGDGVEIFESDHTYLSRNRILVSGAQGIRISNSDYAWLLSNEIHGSLYNGVSLDTVRSTRVEDNYIVYSGNAGISASNSINTLYINDNAIGFSNYGIEITDSWFAAIADNIIHNVETGIKVDAISSSNTVARNEIFDARNGIELSNTLATIDSNVIDVFETGIYFNGGLDGTKTLITENTIRAGQKGILIDSNNTYANALTNGVKLMISDNSIQSGTEGIVIRNAADLDEISIWSNNINAGRSSISIYNNRRPDTAASVGYNRLISSGGSTININDIDNVEVIHNTIEYAKSYGIYVRNFFKTNISENAVHSAQYRGISAWDGSISEINSNIVYKSGSTGGIDIAYNDFSNVSGNLVKFSGRYVDAIGVGNGIAGVGNEFLAITNNEINNSRGNGINDNGSKYKIIDNNIVKYSGRDGISVSGYKSPIEMTNNDVSNSKYYGVLFLSSNHGDILFEGNTLTNNGRSTAPQVRFGSGTVNFGDVNNPNTLVNTTSRSSTAIEFDDYFNDNNIQLVDNTIGATIFEGYADEDSNYIWIGDGSLINPNTDLPYVIDATEASFDGIVPSSFSNNELPIATLTFIEDRIFDADDDIVNGRGQIFVGTAQN